jgi:hypothetical protein
MKTVEIFYGFSGLTETAEDSFFVVTLKPQKPLPQSVVANDFKRFS